jgi:transcription elongation factor Elf1
MNMLAVGGFGLDPQNRTFECLRCGHVDASIKTIAA